MYVRRTSSPQRQSCAGGVGDQTLVFDRSEHDSSKFPGQAYSVDLGSFSQLHWPAVCPSDVLVAMWLGVRHRTTLVMSCSSRWPARRRLMFQRDALILKQGQLPRLIYFQTWSWSNALFQCVLVPHLLCQTRVTLQWPTSQSQYRVATFETPDSSHSCSQGESRGP